MVRMNPYISTIVLAIVSQIGYHIAQKSVPPTASPLLVLAAAYAGAFAICVALTPVLGKPVTMADIRAACTWPTAGVALSIVGIEIGYLLAYRSGWAINIAFPVAGTLTIVILAVAGVAIFGEPLRVWRIVGLVLACLGLWLVVAPGTSG